MQFEFSLFADHAGRTEPQGEAEADYPRLPGLPGGDRWPGGRSEQVLGEARWRGGIECSAYLAG